MYKAVIFDMDGTILNTISDLTAASNYALEQMGRRHDFTEEKSSSASAAALTRIWRRYWLWRADARRRSWNISEVPSPFPLPFSEEDVETLKSFFVPRYAAHCREKTAPYKGIPEVLSALRSHGVLTAVASNKDDRDVQVLAESLFPRLLIKPWEITKKSGASRRRIWYWKFWRISMSRRQRLFTSAIRRWI